MTSLRTGYLRDKMVGLESAKRSLDYQSFDAVKEQGAGKTLAYDSDALRQQPAIDNHCCLARTESPRRTCHEC